MEGNARHDVIVLVFGVELNERVYVAAAEARQERLRQLFCLLALAVVGNLVDALGKLAFESLFKRLADRGRDREMHPAVDDRLVGLESAEHAGGFTDAGNRRRQL